MCVHVLRMSEDTIPKGKAVRKDVTEAEKELRKGECVKTETGCCTGHTDYFRTRSDYPRPKSCTL